MENATSNKTGKKSLLVLGGVICLVVGLVLVLIWWHDVVSLFRGAGSLLIALSGMLMLYSAREH